MAFFGIFFCKNDSLCNFMWAFQNCLQNFLTQSRAKEWCSMLCFNLKDFILILMVTYRNKVGIRALKGDGEPPVSPTMIPHSPHLVPV